MTKKLIEIEQELQQILDVGRQKEAEYIEEVKTARINEEEANKAVIMAKQGDNPEEYAKAIADKRTASDIAGYYEGKIEEIKAEPFITEVEYIEYTNRIKSEMDKINGKNKARASVLLQELEAIKEEVAPAYNKTNELLSNLQNKIYKFTYEKQMADAKKGISLSTERLNNQYKDNSLIGVIDYILTSEAARTIIEQGEGCK